MKTKVGPYIENMEDVEEELATYFGDLMKEDHMDKLVDIANII